MPRPLHRVTPSGTCEATCSTPAVIVCTTRSRGISAISSLSPARKRYGGTKNSTSEMEEGTGSPSPGTTTS